MYVCVNVLHVRVSRTVSPLKPDRRSGGSDPGSMPPGQTVHLNTFIRPAGSVKHEQQHPDGVAQRQALQQQQTASCVFFHTNKTMLGRGRTCDSFCRYNSCPQISTNP